MGRLRNLLKILKVTEIHVGPRHLKDRSLTEKELESLGNYKCIRKRAFLSTPTKDGGYQMGYYSGICLFGPFGEKKIHLKYDEDGKLIEKETYYHDAKGICYHIDVSTFNPHGGIIGRKENPFVRR